MTKPRRGVQRAARWGGLLTVLWAVALLATMSIGINLGDEAWFLQVLARVAHGEVLYRDVFFNTTPGSVWLGVGLIKVFGTDIVVTKLVVSGAVAVASFSCAASARTLGASPKAAVMLGLGGAALGGSEATAGYTPLATAASAACLLAILLWRADGAPADRSTRWLILAGASVGAAFAFKHSIGVSTAAALTLALLLDRHAVTWRSLVACVIAGALVATAAVLPSVLQGGGPKLWEYAVSAKGVYVDRAGVSWLSTLGALPDAIGAGLIRRSLTAVVPALPLIAGVAVAAALAFGRARQTTAIAAVFTLAAVANAYPRADISHFLPAAPILVFAIWLAFDALPGSVGRWLALGGGALVAAAIMILAVSVVRVAVAPSRSLSQVPHLRGVWLPLARQADLIRGSQRLAAAAAGRPTLVVSGDAGGRYLTSGVPNRTPYDFPLVSAFGLHGEAQTAAAVRAGQFSLACLNIAEFTSLRPRALERAIQESMRPGEWAGSCRLYRKRVGR